MAHIPPPYFETVVAIGIDPPDPREDGEKVWVAFGFFYGRQSEENGNKGFLTYLVTNRHVLERLQTQTERAFVRFNPKGGGAARSLPIDLTRRDGQPVWFAPSDPLVDVAVVPARFDMLEQQELEVSLFPSDERVAATTAQMTELGVSEGDAAFVIGFPMGLAGRRRKSPVVRGATIAQIQDLYDGVTNEFLVDASIFPGNSGGPVILKAESGGVQRTKIVSRAHLIGIVKGYIPYTDEAISIQTGKRRISFEENSGLAAVHPVDCIEEAVDRHVAYTEAIKKTAEGTNRDEHGNAPQQDAST